MTNYEWGRAAHRFHAPTAQVRDEILEHVKAGEPLCEWERGFIAVLRDEPIATTSRATVSWLQRLDAALAAQQGALL